MIKYGLKTSLAAIATVATTQFVQAQDISTFGQGLTGVTTSNSSCPGVFEITIPFCREECGQDRSLLNARRGALANVLNAADANGDGRVALDLYSTARRDESQPTRFMNGRNRFLQREAGRVMQLSSVSKGTGYTTGEPYGRVRAADTAQQLRACRR